MSVTPELEKAEGSEELTILAGPVWLWGLYKGAARHLHRWRTLEVILYDTVYNRVCRPGQLYDKTIYAQVCRECGKMAKQVVP